MVALFNWDYFVSHDFPGRLYIFGWGGEEYDSIRVNFEGVFLPRL